MQRRPAIVGDGVLMDLDGDADSRRSGQLAHLMQDRRPPHEIFLGRHLTRTRGRGHAHLGGSDGPIPRRSAQRCVDDLDADGPGHLDGLLKPSPVPVGDVGLAQSASGSNHHAWNTGVGKLLGELDSLAVVGLDPAEAVEPSSMPSKPMSLTCRR